MHDRPVLIGCGILEKEIRSLGAQNGWELDQTFLPSGLHVDFDRLQNCLEKALAPHCDRNTMVFYGTCHPLMDHFMDKVHATRTPGQNCVDIYLGHEIFCRELENGAFFLFEDWALHWQKIIGGIMPGDPEIMRSIFRSAHKYLLAIRTPCSGDFSAEAAMVSEMTSLELRWIDVGLEHLEATLARTLTMVTGKEA